MISSRLTPCGYCYAAILAELLASRKNSLARFSLPELKLGDRQWLDFNFVYHTEVIRE